MGLRVLVDGYTVDPDVEGTLLFEVRTERDLEALFSRWPSARKEETFLRRVVNLPPEGKKEGNTNEQPHSS